MTERELVRFKIDDHLTEAYEEAVSDGEKFLYELDYHPVQSVVVKYDSEIKTVDEDYTLNSRMGQLKLVDGDGVGQPQNEGVVVKVEYQHAAFLDADIDELLSQNGQNATKAAISAIEILLASSARRFDYQQGHTRMSTSQVFEHLKDLHKTLSDELVAQGGQAIIVGDRTSEYWQEGNSEVDNDLSRTDRFNSNNA